MVGSKTESFTIPRPDQTPPLGLPAGTTVGPPVKQAVKVLRGTSYIWQGCYRYICDIAGVFTSQAIGNQRKISNISSGI